MNSAKTSVISHVRDELSVEQNIHRERGVRYWSSVEVIGEQWFQVESCFHCSGKTEVKTFIVRDFPSAKALLPKLRDSTWICLRLYSRAPLLKPSGFLFEAVDRVFELGSGDLLYLLESGDIFLESNCGAQGAKSLQNANEVYSRR